MKNKFADLSDSLKGALCTFLGFSSFAFGDVAFKYLSDDFSVWAIAFYASLISSICYLLAAQFTIGIRSAFAVKNRKLHLLRGTFLSVQFLLIIYAYTQMPLAKAYALFFASPFLASLLSIFVLKETVSLKKWLAISAGFVGVLLILRPGYIPFDIASGAALLSAFFLAAGNITARRIGNEDSPLTFGIYVELVILPVAALLAFSSLHIPDLTQLGLFAFGGALGAAALVLIATGFTLAPASVAAPFQYIQILWGIILGYLIFGDVLDLWTGLGAAIIIGSGLWLIMQERSKEN